MGGPSSIVKLRVKRAKVKTFRILVDSYMKKYKLEILYKDDTDNCEFIEESVNDVEEGKVLEMSDEAMVMTGLLQPLLLDSPDDYYSAMSFALVSGCIVGNA